MQHALNFETTVKDLKLLPHFVVTLIGQAHLTPHISDIYYLAVGENARRKQFSISSITLISLLSMTE